MSHYLVQLEWQNLGLTVEQCWSQGPAEVRRNPGRLGCCGAVPGPALSPDMSTQQAQKPRMKHSHEPRRWRYNTG